MLSNLAKGAIPTHGAGSVRGDQIPRVERIGEGCLDLARGGQITTAKILCPVAVVVITASVIT